MTIKKLLWLKACIVKEHAGLKEHSGIVEELEHDNIKIVVVKACIVKEHADMTK